MRNLHTWLFGFTLVLLFNGCSQTASQSTDIALGLVNGVPITAQDLEQAFVASHQGHGVFLAGKGAVRQFLEKAIDKELLLQEATRIGLDQDLETQQIIEDFRGKHAEEAYYKDKVQADVTISEEEIASAYERMQYRIEGRYILTPTLAEAEKALARIRVGEEFGLVARELSRSPTASKGGYLGVVLWGRLEGQLENVLWNTPEGEVSDPFETSDGWNLIAVIKKVSAERPKLEATSPSIRAVLTKRKTQRRAETFFRDLRTRFDARIHDEVVRQVTNAHGDSELPATLVLADAASEKLSFEQFRLRIRLDEVRELPEGINFRKMRELVGDEFSKILLRKEALALGYGDKPTLAKEIAELRSNVAVNRLLNDIAYAKIDSSDDEAKIFWQTHAKNFTEPAAVKLSVILAESEDDAKEILNALRTGAVFAQLARKRSKDPASAEMGGEIGWVSRSQNESQFEKVAFALSNGDLAVSNSNAGYVVIRVDERKPERLKPFNEVKEQAARLVLQEKMQQTLKQWLTKLRQASDIHIDDEAIEKLIAAQTEKVQEKAGHLQK